MSNQNHDIIFYTFIYKIKSKCDFSKYIEWGVNLIKQITNQHLIIYTNNETLKFIEHLIINKPNINIIIKELDTFEYYKYRNTIEKNKNNIFFPNHNISFELILVWLERHLFIKEISKNINSELYCHIDWGYFRDNNYYENWCNNSNLEKIDKNKIHIGYVSNDHNNDNINNISNIVNSNSYDNMYNIIPSFYNIIAGGCYIIPKLLIDKWYEIYKNTLDNFINNILIFKDDQIILSYIIFNDNNKQYFKLIYNNNEWFMFKDFLNDTNSVKYIDL